MKYIITIIFIFILACCTRNQENFELISYYGGMKEKAKSDTLIPFIKCHLYAQINNDGKCILVRSDYQEKDRFQSLFINNEYFKDIASVIKTIKADTILSIKSNDYIYDGPSIEININNQKGKLTNIRFTLSQRSDFRFVKFYKYIDSISLKSTSDINIDTIKLLNSKDILTQKIYARDVQKWPIIIKEEVPEE